MQNLSTERSIIINAPAANIWDVLVNPEKIAQYLFGSRVETGWQSGMPITFSRTFDSKSYVDKGQILEIIPEKLLKFSYWSSQEGYPEIPENYSVITYLLKKESEETIQLTYKRENIPTAFEQKNQAQFLPFMLENMKRLAEQG